MRRVAAGGGRSLPVVRARLISTATSILGILVVALGLAAALWGVYKQPAIVGSLVTAAAAVAAVVIQRDRENRREVVQRHREQLAPMYESLFQRFSAEGGLDAENDEDREFVFELQRKLVFYGSTQVVREWVSWLRSIPEDTGDASQEAIMPEGPPDPGVLLRFERVLLAIRKDLGHDDEGLQPGDLLRIYVRDIDPILIAWMLEHGQPDLATPVEQEDD
jgi:hypothetical protein